MVRSEHIPARVLKLVISADDLTGANDAGAQFAKRGIRGFVSVGPEPAPLPAGTEMVVINTESRHLSAEVAAQRVSDVVRAGHAGGARWFYKKTDSTLRGNLGAELEAFREATEADVLPYVAAFPHLGRITRNGIHFVHGEPIHKTAFAQDPLNPIRSSSVADILRSQTALPVHIIGRGQNPNGTPPGIWVFDCQEPADFAAIARTLAERNLLHKCSGTAGFAEELPNYIDFATALPKRLTPCGPTLIVNGSLNDRAFTQITFPTAEAVHRIRMDPEVLVGASSARAELVQAILKTVADSPHHHVLLYSAINREDLRTYFDAGRQLGLDEHAFHLRAAETTGNLVSALLRRGIFRSLCVFGGDTLTGIARACGWRGFVPLTEVCHGITVSRSDDGLIVISKAGGFGEDDALDQILNYVRNPP